MISINIFHRKLVYLLIVVLYHEIELHKMQITQMQLQPGTVFIGEIVMRIRCTLTPCLLQRKMQGSEQ